MHVVWFGIKKANIGIDEMIINCPRCKADELADVMITASYFQVCFIPVFPTDKEANIICQNCDLRRYDVPFDKGTFKNFAEIKNQYKYPLYTYAFAAIFTSLIIISILFTVF